MDEIRAQTSRILFVNTPWEKTISIRNLSTSSSILDLKGDLELSTGYPCNTYTLYYGTTCLAKEDMTLFKELAPGAVLKMVIKPELQGVFEHLMTDGEVKDIFDKYCKSEEERGDNDEQNDSPALTEVNYNIGKLFFVAFLSANEGNLAMLKELLHKLPQLLSSKTLLGRTLAHAAAVSDHPQTLLEVLLVSAKHDLRTSGIDRFGKTPLEAAKQNNAFLCERLIKNFNHHQRAGTLGTFLAQGKSGDCKTGKTEDRFKKARAKSAITMPHRSMSAFSTVSSAHSQMKLKKQVSFETVSSGYQTDENRQSRGMLQSQAASPDITKETKSKRVKFKNRIKSAPPKMTSEEENVMLNNDGKFRPSHNTCLQGKPFMAYREVDPNELRSVSVEYIPMARKHFIGMDARNQEKNVQSLLVHGKRGAEPTTPYSSLNTSLQDLSGSQDPDVDEGQLAVKYAWQHHKGSIVQTDDPRVSTQENKKELAKRFTYPKTATSKRAQSANYYKANYHVRAEEDKYYEDIPRPRPKGAGPKYRAWKPWLLELYKQQTKQRKEEARNWEKKHRNNVAFKDWLKSKKQEEADRESSEDEDSDEYTEGETFESWLKKKKPILEKMDRKKKYEQKQLDNPERKPLVDRHVTIYELCSTDGIPMKVDSPYTYMRAYQKWKRRKAKYDQWKKKHGGQVVDHDNDDVEDASLEEVKATRSELYLNGFTYNEWVGQVERESKVMARENKKKVQFTDYVL